MKRLRKRVDALESVTGTTSARSSRLSASSSVNVVDPLDSSYAGRSSAGSTLTRTDNGINLGAAGPAGGTWSGTGQDGAALQRAVQQLVRAELRSDAVRGTAAPLNQPICPWYLNATDPNFCLLVETLAYSLKGERGAPGPKGTFSNKKKTFKN